MSEIDVLTAIRDFPLQGAGGIWREIRKRPEFAWSCRMDVVRVAHRLMQGGYIAHVLQHTTVRYRMTPKGVAFLESIAQSSDAQ